MPGAVLDSTVLVSAFLAPNGPAAAILFQAKREAFTLFLSPAILQETQQVLIERAHLRKRYRYSDEEAVAFCQALQAAAHMVLNPPRITGVSRDPNDDMVIACALASQASYVVTRDEDLLTLKKHKEVLMVTPENFLGILREDGKSGSMFTSR